MIEPQASPPEAPRTLVSGATIIGVFMFLIGILVGWFGRALTMPPAASAPAASAAQASTSAESQRELMKALSAQARHFKGDPAASVTLIEFSDFQ